MILLFSSLPTSAGSRAQSPNPRAMNPLPISQVARFAGASLSSGDGTVVIDKVRTDSRTIKRGELLVALRGENFDGHNFVEAVAKAGAVGAIVEANWKGKFQRPSRSFGRSILCRRTRSLPRTTGDRSCSESSR